MRKFRAIPDDLRARNASPRCHTHVALHCNTLQHTATHCTELHFARKKYVTATPHMCGIALQHIATHYNALHFARKKYVTVMPHVCGIALQHIPTQCNALHFARRKYFTMTTHVCGIALQRRQHIATHCNTLQHIATHCNDIFIHFWDLCTCFLRAFVFCGSIAVFVVSAAKSPFKNCNTLQRYVHVYIF